MGISRHVPPFIEDQSFRFRCRLELLLAPADCVPDVAFRSIAPASPKIADRHFGVSDNGRKRTCRDISIDIRDCPKADTCANCRQPPGEYTLQICRLPWRLQIFAVRDTLRAWIERPPTRFGATIITAN
jgi:hypothetical protein